MEVTTVSPSPASPTEGDDLCETDVTSVAMHSVALLISLCGLAGNGAVIGLLKRKSRNTGIFVFTVIDFLYLLFAVLSALLLLVEDVSCSPILPLLYLNFLFATSAMSYYWGLFWLIFNSTMLYMRTICWLCCRRELPERPRPVLISVQESAFTLLYFVMLMVAFSCTENCQANSISLYTIVLLLFVAPVVISGTIDFIKAKWGSQQQQPKRRDIVTVLVALFILFLSLWNFLQELGYITVPSQAVFLLACIHSTIKPFIYFLVGRCWRPCSMGSLRLSLQRVFEEPRENTAHSHDPAMDTGI
ncbi:mas-related G-protein coupled receptor member H-like [Ammospiza caudacuta]|uniref:mas-related G-protein coupled receptor member H-like n=1 Tax=Ammospiza caudacuta TaxID=2857398 RepID=UPI0027386CA7|nr:mas-related G-protein coupled receptor member H-like [Ammospiza caudacuta]